MCWKLHVDEVEEEKKHKISKRDGKYIVDDSFETEDFSEVMDYIDSDN